MGIVFRAEQVRLKRIVAIKFLHPTPVRKSASNESQVLAQVAHPNIVAVFDSGIIDGREYLVLEYLPNGSLRDRLTGQPWSVRRALPVLGAMADALTAIHLKGLLHLDLKPENVLFDEHGQVKVTDFGLARAQVDAATLSELGRVPGSLDYASLEQRSGLPVDPRADLFSLAVIAYEMLTGQPPGRVFRSALDRNPGLHRGVDDVLRTGLARHPEDRPASVLEFQHALTRALRRWNPPSRRAVLLGLAGIGLLGLLSGALAIWQPWRTTPPGPTPPTSNGPDPEPAPGANNRRPTLTWIANPTDRDPWGTPPGMRLEMVNDDRPPMQLRRLIPLWPAPRPVLLLDSERHQAFFHPLIDDTLGAVLVAQWPHTLEQPEFSNPVNRLQAGTFAGDCLGPGQAWDIPREWSSLWRRGDSVRVGDPGQPGRPRRALNLLKMNSSSPGREVGCQQRITGLRLAPGTGLALRYRAWLEEGHGRLTVAARMGLAIPPDDNGTEATRLRRLAIALPTVEAGAGMPPRFSYRLSDWIAPQPEEHTYWTLWEWSSFIVGEELTIEIAFEGLGRAWVTDVELFTWDRPPAP
jgi:serine/threonine protein kinase